MFSCWIISPCKRVYSRPFLERAGFAFAEKVLTFEDVISSYQLLCRAGPVVLIDEALYFYRVGRPGQITGRSDRSLLDFLPALNIVLDETWNYSASAELWANFIGSRAGCFHGWLHKSPTRTVRRSLPAPHGSLGNFLLGA